MEGGEGGGEGGQVIRRDPSAAAADELGSTAWVWRRRRRRRQLNHRGVGGGGGGGGVFGVRARGVSVPGRWLGGLAMALDRCRLVYFYCDDVHLLWIIIVNNTLHAVATRLSFHFEDLELPQGARHAEHDAIALDTITVVQFALLIVRVGYLVAK